MDNSKDVRELNTEEQEKVAGGQYPTRPDLPEDLQKDGRFTTGKRKLVDSGGSVDYLRKGMEGR